MEFFEVIKKRHSYREIYNDELISRDDLVKIVESGIQAPSACNCQTTHFVIIDQKDLVTEIQKFVSSNAPAFILCITDKNPAPVYAGHSYQKEDCSAAVENMLLSITALGYASVWIDGWLRVNNNNELIEKLIKLPKTKTVSVLLPVGRPAYNRFPAEKMPFEERVSFNGYDLSEN